MAMELLSFNDQLVADFAAHNQHNNFLSLDAQLSQRIGAQPFDGFRRRGGLSF
jgi:hypothetical protein